MSQVRVHLDHLGVERVEIVPEGMGLSKEAFELAGSLGAVILALDEAIRGHFLGIPRRPSAKSTGPNSSERAGTPQ